MKKKIQVLIIHGGMTFKNKKDYINFLKKKRDFFGKKDTLDRGLSRKEIGEKF